MTTLRLHHSHRAHLCVVLVLLAIAPACSVEALPEQEPPPLLQAEIVAGYPSLEAPCLGPVAEPSALVVTSTDFHTGAVGLLDLEQLELSPDLALASSDALPVVSEGRVFVVNRHGFDYIDELDPAELELIHEWPVLGDAASANPHALVLDAQGDAWVPLHGVGQLQRFRFPELTNTRVSADLALDLSPFADADAVPELSMSLRCGDTLFVSAERIDRESWAPAGDTLLIPVRPGDAPALYEFDASTAGPDAIHLRGTGTGPWRLDPDDADAHSIVVLNSGLERIDLSAGTSEWLVDEALFLDAGYGRLQLSGFDFDSQSRIWISAATPDFASFELLRVVPDGQGGGVIHVEFEGLESVTGALEIAGEVAWFADTTLGASGLRALELTAGAVSERAGSPYPVGLPPMSLAPL